jgi:hypothetical protein
MASRCSRFFDFRLQHGIEVQSTPHDDPRRFNYKFGGIVKVTTVWCSMARHDETVDAFTLRERATPSTKPSVSVCRFHG